MENIKSMIKKIMDTVYPNYELLDKNITPLKSGWAGSVYAFSIYVRNNNNRERKDYIIKLYSGNKKGAEGIEKESQALKFLAESGYNVPEYVGHDTLMNEFEYPFMVMEQIKGKMFWDIYQEAETEQKKDMVITFSRLLYDLHKKDIKITKIDTMEEEPIKLIDNELEEIKEILDSYSIEKLRPIYLWLENEKDTVGDLSPSILHRDYHPWNIIIDQRNQPYVIDWVWGIGDYRFDIAWTICLLERGGFDSFAEEALTAYRELLGKEIKNFDYFKVLSTLRWLLNVSVSLISGENLREGERQAFSEFLKMPVRKACETFNEIMNTEIRYTL
ncbi:Phosphotransferase enzyme family protein [Anaerocolumna jejuensis DSM 15929]|uniref:Phosphotransferase enzyme family protein n=1 Tax=Anaerocolumna jejuensis DSM 15929 TaxID=1121322 RepID=A0A1M6Q862_9FIRM|nr:aminoglycoside phosphotransferase family protein [Anaerocolumna jejuensis]SHK16273.1 Phosphotransferase enzyme family protein [Anaerocolumna jejuensis DSM 15929]